MAPPHPTRLLVAGSLLLAILACGGAGRDDKPDDPPRRDTGTTPADTDTPDTDADADVDADTDTDADGDTDTDTDADTDTDTDTDTGVPFEAFDLTGALYRAYARSETPGDVACELYWSVSGTSVPATCPGCDFAFEGTWTYLPDASHDDGTCAAEAVDFTRVLGVDDDTVSWFRYDSGSGWADTLYAGQWSDAYADGYYVSGTTGAVEVVPTYYHDEGHGLGWWEYAYYYVVDWRQLTLYAVE